MAKSSSPVYVKHGAEIIKAIRNLSGYHSTWEVFQDFLAISSISISNCVDWGPQKEREKEYLQIINKYPPEEQSKLAEIFAVLVAELEHASQTDGPYDVLGEVFHGLELHNKYHGQFFTPFHICEMMGRMTVGDKTDKAIQEQGYISLCEPCVGAGGMVLGFANAMQKSNLNYQTELCVTACDIDIKCVHMAYLQLSLFGIPATIIHGNSLSMEQWSVWHTPAYMLGLWPLKEHRNIKSIAEATNNEKEKTVSLDNKNIAAAPENDFEFIVNKNGQISLF